jgi:hypothetical protein
MDGSSPPAVSVVHHIVGPDGLGGTILKYILGTLMAIASAVPAFAVSFSPDSVRPPNPAPSPDLAMGLPAVLAVAAAYVIARLIVRRSKLAVPTRH